MENSYVSQFSIRNNTSVDVILTVKGLEVVPVARLEAFRDLKLSRLESFRVRNCYRTELLPYGIVTVWNRYRTELLLYGISRQRLVEV